MRDRMVSAAWRKTLWGSLAEYVTVHKDKAMVFTLPG